MKEPKPIQGKRVEKDRFLRGVKSLIHGARRWVEERRPLSESALRRNRFLHSSLVSRLVDLRTKTAPHKGEWKRLSHLEQQTRAAMELCMKALWDYKSSRLNMHEREAEVVEYLYMCLHKRHGLKSIELIDEQARGRQLMREAVYRYGPPIIDCVGADLWRKEIDLVGPQREALEAWLSQPLPLIEGIIAATIAQVVILQSLLRQVEGIVADSGPASQAKSQAIFNEILRIAKSGGESSQRDLEDLAPQLSKALLRHVPESAGARLAWAEVLGQLGHWSAAKEMYRSAEESALPGATKARAALGVAAMEMNEANYEACERELASIFDMTDQTELDPLVFGEACAQRGWVRMYRGLHREALGDLTTAKATGRKYDLTLEGHATHFLGRMNYELAIGTADKRTMNDAIMRFLEAEALTKNERNAFHFRWEALCREWLGEQDEVRHLRETALERFGSNPAVAHVWLDEGKRLAREGDVLRGESFLRDALDLFADVMRYPKGTADTQRSLAEVHFSAGRADDFARALELILASLFIYPYCGNRGTRNALALMRMLRATMGETEFLGHLGDMEERWQRKDGAFEPLGRIAIERREVAMGLLRSLRSVPPGSWVGSLL